MHFAFEDDKEGFIDFVDVNLVILQKSFADALLLVLDIVKVSFCLVKLIAIAQAADKVVHKARRFGLMVEPVRLVSVRHDKTVALFSNAVKS